MSKEISGTPVRGSYRKEPQGGTNRGNANSNAVLRPANGDINNGPVLRDSNPIKPEGTSPKKGPNRL